MTNNAKKADVICKIVIIGDSGVGKTCFMRRFTDDEFSNNFVATIGIDFRIRNVQIREKQVKVQIWDTAGQEKFRSITTAYYRGANGVIIAYDITDRLSFANITNWVNNFRRWSDLDVEKVLVGNKCDMEDSRAVTTKEGEKLAKLNNMFFSETSAKNNINVEKVFMELLDRIVAKQEAKLEEAENNSNRLIGPQQNKQNKQNKNENNLSCCKL